MYRFLFYFFSQLVSNSIAIVYLRIIMPYSFRCSKCKGEVQRDIFVNNPMCYECKRDRRSDSSKKQWRLNKLNGNLSS